MAKRILYKRPDGKWAWRLESDKGRIIAAGGGQGYENEGDAASMADRIIRGEFKDAEKLASSDPIQPRAQTPSIDAVAAVESARSRGQSAWAISSALAGALIAGGVLTNASERPWWAQLLGLLAILAWIVTATLFISAVSGIDPLRKGPRSIDAQLSDAYYGTLGAIVLTLAALVGGLVSSVAPAHIKASVVLKPETLAKVRSVCPDAPTASLKGAVERGSLKRPFVVIVLEKGQCKRGEPKRVTLEVPQSTMEAFRSR